MELVILGSLFIPHISLFFFSMGFSRHSAVALYFNLGKAVSSYSSISAQSLYLMLKKCRLGMVTHVCDTNIWAVESGISGQVYPCLHNELEADLGYLRVCLNKETKIFNQPKTLSH